MRIANRRHDPTLLSLSRYVDNERVAKVSEALTALFDPAQYLSNGIGEIEDHQRALPWIAKDKTLVGSIEEKLEQIPTRHDLYRADARKIDFLEPESVHLVVTSPPYWTLNEYNFNKAQLGAISNYDQFLDHVPLLQHLTLVQQKVWGFGSRLRGRNREFRSPNLLFEDFNPIAKRL